jgi:4-amino-4-deoxy-L-arabinose transferase-like glycosyltransferase
MLVAQILNFIGFFYVAATARILLGSAGVVAALIALCGGLFFIDSTSTNALNGDQILFPLWSGVLYHGLQALRQDRWRDWIALGIVVALSLLAKYFSALFLVALVANLIWNAPLRRTFRNPRFYIAALIGALLCLPTAIAVLSHQTSLYYGRGFFNLDLFDWRRAEGLALLLVSPLIYGVPFLIAVTISIRRKQATFHPRLDNSEQRLVVGTALLLIGSLFLLILVAGLIYPLRYFTPLYGIGILAMLCVVRITPAGMRLCLGVALWGWALSLVGTATYASLFLNSRLREPAPAAAVILRDAWNSQFSCGPAYLLGDPLSAYAVALYFPGGVTGVSIGDYWFAQWVDRVRLRRLGAIAISTPEREGELKLFSAPPSQVPPSALPNLAPLPVLPNQASRATIELPYRRTLSDRRHVYVYSFIAPEGCGQPPAASR